MTVSYELRGGTGGAARAAAGKQCWANRCHRVPEIAELVGHDKAGHRICNALHSNGITTVAALDALAPAELHAIWGIGADSMNRIIERLKNRTGGQPMAVTSPLAGMAEALTAHVRDSLQQEFPNWRIELEPSGRWTACQEQWGTLYGQSAAELRERLRARTAEMVEQNGT